MDYIKKSKFSKILRNLFGYKPSLTVLNMNKKNLSTSDAFFWRTDNNFKTIFKFTDLLNLYFNDQGSSVDIMFYDKFNKLLKKLRLSNINLSNKLIIDKDFMNGIEDYGTFYIFHVSNLNNNSVLRNSCYTGYSINNNLPSFVHGNLINAVKNLNDSNLEIGIGGITPFKNNIYQIQNSFIDCKLELLISNPSKKKLKILINDKKIYLEPCCSTLESFENTEVIKIISKCYLLRPIIFSYKKNYLDVYHG